MRQGPESPESHEKATGILRWALTLVGLAALLLLYLTAAAHAPWPIFGLAGFVWGAGLVAVAIGYALKSKDELSPTGVKWGIALAVVAYFLVIVLNQLISSPFLHSYHKLLAFMAAFYVFVAWITAQKRQTRHRVSPR